MFEFLKKKSKNKGKKLSEQQIKNINRVAKETGWDFETAKNEMKRAKKENGILFSEYAKYELFRYSNEEQPRILVYLKAGKNPNEFYDNSKKELSNKQKKLISAVAEKAGWDFEHAKKEMDKAKKQYSISYRLYLKYDFYSFDESLVEQQAEYIRNREKSLEMQKEQRIFRVMDRTGWTYDETVADMQKAKASYGASNVDYVKFELFEIPEEERESFYIGRKERQKKAVEENAKHVISKIAEVTGWSEDEACERVDEASKRTHCTVKEYFIYRFYELTEEEQDEVFLSQYSRNLSAKYDVDPEFSAMLFNKEATNNYFSEYVRRPWCVNTKVSLDDFKEIFKGCNRIIYKPIAGHKGFGVTAYDLNDENIEDIYNQLKDMPKAVVEKFVAQHEVMSSIAPSSVNTVRFVTVSSSTRPVTPQGDYFEIAYASLRIGGGTSIVDNFHSGGMCAVADLETGELITVGADQEGNFYEKHPLTGVKIKGFKIPYFKEAREMVEEACVKNKVDGYLGWDIAISENGPMLIELNVVPGVVLASTPLIAEKKGIKKRIQRYLDA